MHDLGAASQPGARGYVHQRARRAGDDEARRGAVWSEAVVAEGSPFAVRGAGDGDARVAVICRDCTMIEVPET